MAERPDNDTLDPQRLAATAAAHARRLAASGVTRVSRSAPARPKPVVAKPPRATPSTSTDPQTLLDALKRQVLVCTRCPLHMTRTQGVFGHGNPRARLVFVGEAPGRDEDEQGVPFVGAAGQLLTKMIEAIQLRREDVYICNVLKSRPPNNRQPQPEEVEACRPYLTEQLRILQPELICVLGTVAAKTLLGPHIAITAARGNLFDYEGIPVIPTFHPAYLLRNPDAKKDAWQDLKRVRKFLDERAGAQT